MNILGLNSVFHESSAALVVDGEVVAACEEERFTRVKHGKEPRVDNPQVLPEKAIAFCLEHAGLLPRDIDRVAYSFDPQLRRETFRPEWWFDPRWEPIFLQHLEKVGDAADKILGRRAGRKLAFVPHHVAHAASAYPSGFDPAAILIIRWHRGGVATRRSCSARARGSPRSRRSRTRTRWLHVGAAEQSPRLLQIRRVRRRLRRP